MQKSAKSWVVKERGAAVIVQIFLTEASCFFGRREGLSQSHGDAEEMLEEGNRGWTLMGVEDNSLTQRR